MSANSFRVIRWTDDAVTGGLLRVLDQTLLPQVEQFVECLTIQKVYQVIQDMVVRGAPAIGIAGAYGLCLASFTFQGDNVEEYLAFLQKQKEYIDTSRPTAVNLMWSTKRLLDLLTYLGSKNYSVEQLKKVILAESNELAEDDIAINRKIGEYGASLVPDKKPANLIHHCNTGFLATVGHGTALGVIYSCKEAGKDIHVYVDETRPRLQGAKLTCYELKTTNIPFHLIPDSAAASLMYQGKVDCVVYGADRVAANGDVANKVGTMPLNICATEYGVPTYACVPTSTIDLETITGKDIVIEERSAREVTHVGKEQITVDDCKVFNPAFDVTPNKYISAIITEEGICYPPYTVSLREAKEKAEARFQASWERSIQKYA